MAQLPPKIPNTAMSTNWPGFFPAAAAQHPWIDEFLDFSSARRGAHRRSASDPVTFLDPPEEDEFERLDDDQLTSMFSDQAPTAPASSSATTPSTPSDHNSVNEEKADPAAARQHPPPEPPVDPRRVRRVIANRQSAQRSRVRKLQYITDLERSVTSLQNEVSALSPRVAFLDHQRSLLTVGNSALKQRIAALAQDKIFKDAHQDALKKEIERLRQVYQQQNMKKTASGIASYLPMSESTPVTEKELLG